MILLKAKLKKMAKIRKTSLAGLYARAIFITVSESLAERTFFEKKVKYETLNALHATCISYSVRLYPKEKAKFSALKFELESLLKIDLTDQNAVEKVLSDSFSSDMFNPLEGDLKD